VSANATRRCLAATGSVRKVPTKTNVTFGGVNMGFGEVERAATQTVHFAAFASFEC
jgi:hypothetical protein